VANQAVFVLLCIEAGLLSGHGVDGHLDYRCGFQLGLRKRMRSFGILGGDNLQGLSLFLDRFNQASPAEPDHALVAHVPIAGVKRRYGFGQDVELETDLRVLLKQFSSKAVQQSVSQG